MNVESFCRLYSDTLFIMMVLPLWRNIRAEGVNVKDSITHSLHFQLEAAQEKEKELINEVLELQWR